METLGVNFGMIARRPSLEVAQPSKSLGELQSAFRPSRRRTESSRGRMTTRSSRSEHCETKGDAE